MHPRPASEAAARICHLPGCTMRVAPVHLMCVKHWYEVPPELRTQVSGAFLRWQRGEIPAGPYLIARLKAIIHVGKLHGRDVAALEAELAAKEKTRL